MGAAAHKAAIQELGQGEASRDNAASDFRIDRVTLVKDSH
jgi:hypothetical protein